MKVGNSRDSQTSSGQQCCFGCVLSCVWEMGVWTETKGKILFRFILVTEMKLHCACKYRLPSLKIISNICALEDGPGKQVTQTDF